MATTLQDSPEITVRQRITFPDLVRIHFRWRQALRHDSGVPEDEQLSLVDARGENPSQAHRAAVAIEVRQLGQLRRDYREAANGDAQLIYFAGMAIGIGLLAWLYVIAGGILHGEGVDERAIIGCLVAGAVVSVIARINSPAAAKVAAAAKPAAGRRAAVAADSDFAGN